MIEITQVYEAVSGRNVKLVVSLSFHTIKSERKIFHTLWNRARLAALSTTNKTFLLRFDYTLKS